MIEAVENHNPETIVIDEIGASLEAQAARTSRARRATDRTAHGNTLDNLLLNPTLSDRSAASRRDALRRGSAPSGDRRRRAGAPRAPDFQRPDQIQTRNRLAVLDEVPPRSREPARAASAGRDPHPQESAKSLSSPPIRSAGLGSARLRNGCRGDGRASVRETARRASGRRADRARNDPQAESFEPSPRAGGRGSRRCASSRMASRGIACSRLRAASRPGRDRGRS